MLGGGGIGISLMMSWGVLRDRLACVPVGNAMYCALTSGVKEKRLEYRNGIQAQLASSRCRQRYHLDTSWQWVATNGIGVGGLKHGVLFDGSMVVLWFASSRPLACVLEMKFRCHSFSPADFDVCA